jgi:hypothetical protein
MMAKFYDPLGFFSLSLLLIAFVVRRFHEGGVWILAARMVERAVRKAASQVKYE